MQIVDPVQFGVRSPVAPCGNISGSPPAGGILQRELRRGRFMTYLRNGLFGRGQIFIIQTSERHIGNTVVHAGLLRSRAFLFRRSLLRGLRGAVSGIDAADRPFERNAVHCLVPDRAGASRGSLAAFSDRRCGPQIGVFRHAAETPAVILRFGTDFLVIIFGLFITPSAASGIRPAVFGSRTAVRRGLPAFADHRDQILTDHVPEQDRQTDHCGDQGNDRAAGSPDAACDQTREQSAEHAARGMVDRAAEQICGAHMRRRILRPHRVEKYAEKHKRDDRTDQFQRQFPVSHLSPVYEPEDRARDQGDGEHISHHAEKADRQRVEEFSHG